MALKRKHSETQTSNSVDPSSSQPRPKKPRKGFAVGPEHLPDGQYRRKVQRIKKTLIDKAKLKKSLSRVRSQQRDHSQHGPSEIPAQKQAKPHYDPYRDPEPLFPPDLVAPPSQTIDSTSPPSPPPTAQLTLPASLALHPDRQQRNQAPSAVTTNPDPTSDPDPNPDTSTPRKKRPKPSPFRAAELEATARRQEAVSRRADREEERKRWQQEQKHREWERRQLERARGVRNGSGRGGMGRRKLGAESGVMLERVRRLVGGDGEGGGEGGSGSGEFAWMRRQA